MDVRILGALEVSDGGGRLQTRSRSTSRSSGRRFRRTRCWDPNSRIPGANAAWTVIACLAHNLLRWTELLGLRDQRPRRARTLRRRLLALPGRLTRSARRWTLHLPARWPWQADFLAALACIRALPAPG